ncbi:MAG: hypothetical protein ACLUD0_05910 [Eubacterium ramulus]
MAYVRAEQKKKGTGEKDESAGGDIFLSMYVAAENVIGDVEGVTLENLSEPQTGCLHDYQLTAADIETVVQSRCVYRKWRWHRELFIRCGKSIRI